jgi:hypothetical protein
LTSINFACIAEELWLGVRGRYFGVYNPSEDVRWLKCKAFSARRALRIIGVAGAGNA